MRVLVLYANPNDKSFGAVLHRQVIQALVTQGHRIDDCDLYAEAFDPILSQQDRADYHDPRVNRARVASYPERLLSAEGLVLIFPVWNEGFPAIMKGFFDRVFIPGVSFAMGVDGSIIPSLENLRKLASVCTYGADRLTTFLLGDPPRRVVKRLVRAMPGHRVSCDYLALYDMNRITMEKRQAFITKVERAFQAW
jgi:NAD(P)H dehydrogenase (quinone)